MTSKTLKTLNEWRETIRCEAVFVNKKPYSHNIIALALSVIDKKFGTIEANKAIEDFKLKKLGWRPK